MLFISKRKKKKKKPLPQMGGREEWKRVIGRREESFPLSKEKGGEEKATTEQTLGEGRKSPSD